MDTSVKSLKTERDNALEEARQYRNLAESMRTQCRHVKSQMSDKLEVVRDFWRNALIEGSSRSSRMLRTALEANKV